MTVRDCAAELSSSGFAQISGPFRTSNAAFDVAGALVETCRLEHGLPSLSVIGDFVLPPLDGAETRDFQTLHFDFGLPLDPKVEGDVARYTALYIPADVTGVRAVTRLVPLAALLAQRSWPPPAELVERLRSYGRTHGAWDDEEGYVEGSLARIVEAATAERSPTLPSVRPSPVFSAVWSSTACPLSSCSLQVTACTSRTPRSTSRCSPENCCCSTTWRSRTADAERANQESYDSASTAIASSRRPKGSCATTC